MKNISTLIAISLLFIANSSYSQFNKISSPVSSDGLESKGVSWIDYDNDGDQDLFVTTSLNGNMARKNLLYQNNGDGTFSKLTLGDLVNDEATGRNSTWADFNNDGLIDVFVVSQLETALYKNSGGGVFTKQLLVPTSAPSFNSCLSPLISCTNSEKQICTTKLGKQWQEQEEHSVLRNG